jgi:hypothetical protein
MVRSQNVGNFHILYSSEVDEKLAFNTEYVVKTEKVRRYGLIEIQICTIKADTPDQSQLYSAHRPVRITQRSRKAGKNSGRSETCRLTHSLIKDFQSPGHPDQRPPHHG